MERLTNLFKSLSDETRVRILHMLYHQDLCVCELVDILELSQPKISKHMAKLKSAGLVTSSRNEQWIYYSFNKEYSLNNILKTIFNDYKDEKKFIDDINRLHSVESFVCTRDV